MNDVVVYAQTVEIAVVVSTVRVTAKAKFEVVERIDLIEVGVFWKAATTATRTVDALGEAA